MRQTMLNFMIEDRRVKMDRLKSITNILRFDFILHIVALVGLFISTLLSENDWSIFTQIVMGISISGHIYGVFETCSGLSLGKFEFWCYNSNPDSDSTESDLTKHYIDIVQHDLNCLHENTYSRYTTMRRQMVLIVLLIIIDLLTFCTCPFSVVVAK